MTAIYQRDKLMNSFHALGAIVGHGSGLFVWLFSLCYDMVFRECCKRSGQLSQ